MKIILMLASALMLGGCVTDTATTSIDPVCAALIGPITYSSTNKKSRRYAGPDLAPDLALRNRVGVNLSCPAYH